MRDAIATVYRLASLLEVFGYVSPQCTFVGA